MPCGSTREDWSNLTISWRVRSWVEYWLHDILRIGWIDQPKGFRSIWQPRFPWFPWKTCDMITLNCIPITALYIFHFLNQKRFNFFSNLWRQNIYRGVFSLFYLLFRQGKKLVVTSGICLFIHSTQFDSRRRKKERSERQLNLGKKTMKSAEEVTFVLCTSICH